MRKPFLHKISKIVPGRIRRPVYWYMVIHTVQCFFRLFYRVRVFGCHPLPSRRRGLLNVSNHVSYLDPPFAGSACYGAPPYFMARDTLFKNFFFGTLIRLVHAFPVQRGKADREAIKSSVKVLREEKGWLYIFPEGTRSPDGRLQKLRAGFVAIAKMSGVGIRPIIVHGLHSTWPRGTSRPRFFTAIKAYFSRVIPADKVKKISREQVAEIVMHRWKAMRRWASGEKPADVIRL